MTKSEKKRLVALVNKIHDNLPEIPDESEEFKDALEDLFRYVLNKADDTNYETHH